MGVVPPAVYLDRASEVMERRERDSLQVGLATHLCFDHSPAHVLVCMFRGSCIPLFGFDSKILLMAA